MGRTSCHHAKYGGDRGSRAGCRRKSVMFFVCLSRFGITKFVITETLWSSVIFKTIMVSLHWGRIVVVHLYSTFSVDPLNFSLGENSYKKLSFFRDFGDCKPTFLKPQRWNLACGCGPGTPSPRPNSVKTLKGLAKLYQKLAILAIFGL